MLTSGFVLWNTWKECNNRIFKDSNSSTQVLWNSITKNLQETIHSKGWSNYDLPTSPCERRILDALNFNSSVVPPSPNKPIMRVASPMHWDPPPKKVFKLNFDGASNGNLGMAGFGGAIRKYKGEIIHLFYGNIGFNSNNATEIEGMIAGLTIVDNNSILPVIVEGDSAIILSLAAKLLHGSLVSKVTTS